MSPREDMEERCKESGRRAFAAGRKRVECPFKSGCAAWTWWLAGYWEAEEQQEAK